MRRANLVSMGLLVLGLLIAAPTLAQNSTRAGEFVVHYNALPTTQLSPAVARQYGITRSANRALVNIAIRQTTPGGDRAVQAQVSLWASNLAGQRVNLRAREVREGDAIYYLAEARTVGQDTLTFELEVTVVGKPPIKAQFRQEFFVE